MVIILMGLVIFAAILIVGYPLVNERNYGFAEADPNGDENFEHLASARNSVFEAIRDLEFDKATDKLSDSDYRMMRARYDVKAAEVLQKMDALSAAKTRHAAKEAAAPVDEPAAGRGSQTAEAKRSFCTHCGAHVEAADRFCPVCGKRQK